MATDAELEAAREEGRREILAEVRKINPASSFDVRDWPYCLFCLVDGIGWYRRHEPDCLYRRACEAEAAEKTSA